MRMKKLEFYIIITPLSLKFVKFAIWSLKQRKDMRLTLVANGLGETENIALKQFCNQIDCDYKDLRATTVLPHGVALNKLLELHQEPWFCFCDSDIISTKADAFDIPISADIKALSACDAMFWDESIVKGTLGRCNRWPDGSQNLSSFFCLYHTETVKKLVKKYKIGFENIAANQIQSSRVAEMLTLKGIKKTGKKLDTGKVINIALELESESFSHIDIPSLLHIGGLSSWILNGNTELINSNYILTDQELYQVAPSDSWLFNVKATNDTQNKLFYLRRQQRLAAARFCFQLISHYVDGTPKPYHHLTIKNLISKLDKIELAIQTYFEKFT